jgi:hypothetical protein
VQVADTVARTPCLQNMGIARQPQPDNLRGRELVDNTFGTLYYNRARYLDTAYYLRFLSRDPMGLSGGSYASL